MIHLHDIRYLRIGTRDLDAAIAFATGTVGLELAGRDRKAAYFRGDKAAVRGDTRDHTLVYFEGDPSDHAAGFELADPEALERAAAALEAAGRPVRLGTREECEQRRVKAFIASRDPSGNRIEIVARPFHSGARYAPARDAGVVGLAGAELGTTGPSRDEAFWTGTLGARVSDWIGEAPLLRLGTIHHSLALVPSGRPGIRYIDHQVEDIDDVMRAYYFLTRQGVPILLGPGRSPASSAIFLHFAGPDGMIFGYSVGARHIPRGGEAEWRPRQFPWAPGSFCMWGSHPGMAAQEAATGEGTGQAAA